MPVLEEIAAQMKEGHFHCALCFKPFKTHEEKVFHMEVVHGYETLHVEYVKPEVPRDT